MSVEEFTYLRGRTTRPVKVTLLSAQQAAAYYDPDKSTRRLRRRATPISPTSSTSRGARSRSCARLGCEYMQIDAPQYAALLDETIREGYRQRGSDPDQMLDACIELDNAIIDGPPRRHVRHPHLPRQSQEHVLRVGRLRPDRRSRSSRAPAFDRFLLEYDDERSGTFEPLRHVPDDRVVVLGLVSSKTPRLESADDLERAHRRGRARSCRSSASRSARSAASPPRTKATGSRPTISARSWSSSRAPLGRYGTEKGYRAEEVRLRPPLVHVLVHSPRVRVAAVSPSPTHRLACRRPGDAAQQHRLDLRVGEVGVVVPLHPDERAIRLCRRRACSRRSRSAARLRPRALSRSASPPSSPSPARGSPAASPTSSGRTPRP